MTTTISPRPGGCRQAPVCSSPDANRRTPVCSARRIPHKQLQILPPRPGCTSPGAGLFRPGCESPGTGLFRPGCGCRAPVCSARRILHTQLQLSPPGTHHSFSVLSESSRQFIKSIMRYPCPDPDGRHPAGLICCKHSLTTTAPHSSTAISCIVGLVCSARENKY